MITQKDLDEIENRLKESFITKDDFTGNKDELFNKLDSIVKNTLDTNQESSLLRIEFPILKLHFKLLIKIRIY